jgi:hypothetical protein
MPGDRNSTTTREQFRVVLAQRVTGGDYPEYVELVRKDKPDWRTPDEYKIFESPFDFDSPLVQAGSLEHQMVMAGDIVILPSAPDYSFGISVGTIHGSPAARQSLAMFSCIRSPHLVEDFGRSLSKVSGWSASEWRTERRATASALSAYEKEAKNLKAQLAAETSNCKKAAEIRERITKIESCLLQLQQGKERIAEEMRLGEKWKRLDHGSSPSVRRQQRYSRAPSSKDT